MKAEGLEAVLNVENEFKKPLQFKTQNYSLPPLLKIFDNCLGKFGTL